MWLWQNADRGISKDIQESSHRRTGGFVTRRGMAGEQKNEGRQVDDCCPEYPSGKFYHSSRPASRRIAGMKSAVVRRNDIKKEKERRLRPSIYDVVILS